MISKKGYTFLKKTNEDDYDSTSKPGPSSKTRDEGHNDKGGVASSSPAFLELSKVECLSCGERSKSQWTHSCPQIPNNEVPKKIRASWSDFLSELKRGSDEQNGGEEGNRRSSVDESYQWRGGEEGTRRSSGDESYQQNGGEEGNRRNSGEGRVELVLGEVRTNCWSRFKRTYFSCALCMTKSGCVYLLLAVYPWLAILTVLMGWFHGNECPPIPAVTTALALFGMLLACFWFCSKGFPDRYRCRRCLDWNKYLLFTLFGIFVVCFIAEFVYFLSVKCENPFFGFAVAFQFLVAAFLLAVIIVYYPDMYASPRTEERTPLRTATHEEGQNGDGRQPEAEEQV